MLPGARTGLLMVLVSTGAACSTPVPPQTSTQIGDTLVVRNSAPAIPDTLVPREIMRVGQLNGPLEQVFSDVLAFTTGPDGSIFVHDRDDGIRRFSPGGEFLGYVARDGRGPTEVGYVQAMAASAGGELAAVDLTNGQVRVFDLESGAVTGVRRPKLRPRYVDGGLLYRQDGTLWMGVHPSSPGRGPIPHPRPTFLQVDAAAGDFPDTIFTPASAASACETLSTGEFRAGYWEDSREPFVPKTTWALGSAGSLAVGCPEDYSLDVYRPGGGVVRINRSWSPLVMSDQEQEHMSGQAGTRDIPRERPAYARILLPGDGRTWVWPNQPGVWRELAPALQDRLGETGRYRIASTGSFDVFGAEGRWLATVRLPAEARFSGFPTERGVVIRGDTLWALAEDELGVQSIRRYEVPELSGIGEVN